MDDLMKFSVCTTNYQCAHALERHLESVYQNLKSFDFEYIVVDSKSKDRSLEILKRWESKHSNMKVFSKKCTMGEGRQISFENSSGEFIIVMDTDVVYSKETSRFLEIYLEKYADLAVQAIMLGIFPRNIWREIGGRRSLNAFEDVDMWIRIVKLGRMKWYPVLMGENVKDASAVGGYDFLSERYGKRERFLRLLRKEYDLFKTRKIRKLDLERIKNDNLVDFGLGELEDEWFKNYPKMTPAENVRRLYRQMKQTLKG